MAGEPVIPFHFFSLVIPTFNSGNFLQPCLSSIAEQQFTGYEIICVDGGSTDNTIEIIKSFDAGSGKISYSSEPDLGVYEAMNKGLKSARGKWILFLGSDDRLFNRNVLGDAFAALDDTAAELVYGNCIVEGDSLWAKNGTVYDGQFTAAKLMDKNICHQSIFYLRQSFSEVGYFNVNYPVCGDWDMNHRFFARAKTQFIPQVIAVFQSGGITTAGNHDLYTDHDCVFNIRKYYRISFLHGYFKSYCDLFYNIYIKDLEKARYWSAFYYFLISWYHSPDKMTSLKSFAHQFGNRIFQIRVRS